MVYYSERLHVECAIFAGELIARAPSGASSACSAWAAPAQRARRGPRGSSSGEIRRHPLRHRQPPDRAVPLLLRRARRDGDGGRRRQLRESDYPELEDYGHANLVADNGATNYFRVDWLTPAGLRTWGDGRTRDPRHDGYIELRKYIDLARDSGGDQLFLVNGEGEKHFSLAGKVGFPFFGQLILDCLNRTENAMTQAHAFKAAELCLQARGSGRPPPSRPARSWGCPR
jgi:hypothetical protein